MEETEGKNGSRVGLEELAVSLEGVGARPKAESCMKALIRLTGSNDPGRSRVEPLVAL